MIATQKRRKTWRNRNKSSKSTGSKLTPKTPRKKMRGKKS